MKFRKVQLYFWITYIFFLFLPLISMSIVYPRVLETSKNQKVEMTYDNLKRTQQILDLTFGEIDRLVGQMALFPNFSMITEVQKPDYSDGEAAWQLIEIQKMFKPLTIRNPLIYDYNVLSFPNGFAYNNSRIVSDLDFFYKNIFNYLDWTKEEWLDNLYKNAKHQIIAEKDVWINEPISSTARKRLVTYLHSVDLAPSDGEMRKYVAQFLIDGESLRELLDETHYEVNGVVILSDFSGNILISEDLTDDLIGIDVSQLLVSKKSEITFNGKTYLLSYLPSDTHEYIILSLIPLEQLLEEINYVKKIVLFVTILILLLGILTAWFFSWYQYKDLSAILQLLSEDGIKDIKAYNVFQFMKTRVSQQYLEMALQVDRISSLYTRMILNGEWEDSPQKERILTTLQLHNENNFAVMIVSAGPLPSFPQESILPPCALTVNESALIFQGTDNLGPLIKETIEALDKRYDSQGEVLMVAVGPVVSSLNEVRDSQKNAMKAFSKTGVARRIIYSNQEEDVPERLHYPLDFETRIINATLSGSTNKLSKLLKKFFEENISLLRGNVDCRTRFFSQLEGTLIRIYESTEYPLPQKRLIPPDSSYEQGLEISIILFTQISIKKEKSKRSHNETLLNMIDSYMEENFSNILLNGNMIASHCHISVTYLSAFLKEQRGLSYGKMLERIKMREAQQLLKMNQMMISEISRACGYDNDGSFRRRFKVVTGLSPSSYREMALSGKLLTQEEE